jgi:hypothetical protein
MSGLRHMNQAFTLRAEEVRQEPFPIRSIISGLLFLVLTRSRFGFPAYLILAARVRRYLSINISKNRSAELLSNTKSRKF